MRTRGAGRTQSVKLLARALDDQGVRIGLAEGPRILFSPALVDANRKFGLKVNENKTKYMLMPRRQNARR
jgi:hypothetical protein